MNISFFLFHTKKKIHDRASADDDDNNDDGFEERKKYTRQEIKWQFLFYPADVSEQKKSH